MSNTANLGLPLLQAAQAQKHVTVNEALVLLDGVSQLVLSSVDTTLPPVLANDGDCYGVPVGAVNEWAGRGGEVAVRTNGGWVFVMPQRGWRAQVADKETVAIFDGALWVAGVVALSTNNAATVHEVLEFDHSVSAGASNQLIAAIPAFSMVVGVTGRITTTITGTLSDWKLGVAANDDRYGSGLGLPLGSWIRGLTSAPQSYYSDTDLLLTAVGGDFAAGDVRIAVHLMRLTIPSV